MEYQKIKDSKSRNTVLFKGRNFTDRRRGPDVLVKMIKWFAVITWLLLLSALFIVGFAKPRQETLFDRMFAVSVSSSWDLELMAYSVLLMVLNFGFSVTGIFTNLLRFNRKEDHFSLSLIVNLFASAVFLCWYFAFLPKH